MKFSLNLSEIHVCVCTMTTYIFDNFKSIKNALFNAAYL